MVIRFVAEQRVLRPRQEALAEPDHLERLAGVRSSTVVDVEHEELEIERLHEVGRVGWVAAGPDEREVQLDRATAGDRDLAELRVPVGRDQPVPLRIPGVYKRERENKEK